MNISYIGIIIGIVASVWMSICSPHCPNKSNIILLFPNVYFHFHHWMYAFILLYLFDVLDVAKKIQLNDICINIIRGILVGSIAHGLTYRDSVNIIY